MCVCVCVFTCFCLPLVTAPSVFCVVTRSLFAMTPMVGDLSDGDSDGDSSGRVSASSIGDLPSVSPPESKPRAGSDSLPGLNLPERAMGPRRYSRIEPSIPELSVLDTSDLPEIREHHLHTKRLSMGNSSFAGMSTPSLRFTATTEELDKAMEVEPLTPI